MSQVNVSRRGFLKATGLTATAALALSLSGVSLATGAWSMQLTVLDEHTGRVLSGLCRTLYPHARLADMYYDACVEGLDAQAATDSELAALLKQGVADLDKAAGSSFLEVLPARQLEIVNNIEGSPFFNKVRSHMVVALYDNKEIWNKFGYEGSSFERGGYLENGFNDIAWLPKV